MAPQTLAKRLEITMSQQDNSKEERKARVLVVGSQRFDQRDFVFGMLNGFQAILDLGTLISGPFSGTDQFAREWARENGVGYEALDLPQSERMELRFFDEHRKLPPSVIKNDPMFRKGFEKIRQAAADAILVIPTPEGRLGPTTACLKTLAEAYKLPVIDGSEALASLQKRMSEQAALISGAGYDESANVARARRVMAR